MKRRNLNERVQLVWLGKRPAEEGHGRSVPPDLLSSIREEIALKSRKLESDIGSFDWSLLLPLLVVLGMARSSRVRRGYLDMNSPAFVEYLTALALKRADRSPRCPTLRDTLDIRDENEHLFWLCSGYFNAFSRNSENGDEDMSALLTNARMNYMLVRGETHETNFLDQASKLFRPEAKYLEKSLGFNIDQAILFVKTILGFLNARLLRHRNVLASIFTDLAATEVNSSVWPAEVYRPRLGQRQKTPSQDVVDGLPQFAKGLYSVDEEELTSLVHGEDREAFRTFLRCVSLSPGQVDGCFLSPMDPSPLQDAPVVKLGGTYFFHASQYLARWLVYGIDKRVKKDQAHAERYNRTKSRYLEDESINIFKRVFPGAEVYQRLRYSIVRDGRDVATELDGLIKHDDCVFLIECATHPVTAASKKGVKDAVAHDVGQSIQRTFKQAQRAREYIKGKGQATFALSDGSEVMIDASSVRNYFLVCVTLDSYDIFAADPRRLRGLGLFPENEYPWVINIGNLQTIADFIELPSQFVHYLKKRMTMSDQVYASDELDYFGCYLISNLDIPIPSDATTIEKVLIVNATSDFDLYLSYKQGHRRRVPRPGQYIPRNFKSILLRLERNRHKGYTDISCAMLDIPYSFRKAIGEHIASTLGRCSENRGELKDFSIFNAKDQWGFTYFCGDGRLPGNVERFMALPEYCMDKMEQTGIHSWIGIVRDTSLRRPFVGIFLGRPTRT